MPTTDRKKKKTLLHVRSRHPSHRILRRNPLLRTFGKRILFRLGSTTELNNVKPYHYEINSVEAIKNSSDKLKMKKCFQEVGCNTAVWFTLINNKFYLFGNVNSDPNEFEHMSFPLIAKGRFGSRGNSNTKIDSIEELQTWLQKPNRTLNNYIFEFFFNGPREYRLHVSKFGCFYTNRKLRRDNAEERWFFNNQNCVWILETNPSFNKPNTWNDIVMDCQKGLKAVGLDLGAFDVRVNTDGHWCIIEVNSAPSFGDLTGEKYIQELNKIIQENK
jgi:glutathione synthase/RimK-type ligase-like ATP-grasp enzyme